MWECPSTTSSDEQKQAVARARDDRGDRRVLVRAPTVPVRQLRRLPTHAAPRLMSAARTPTVEIPAGRLPRWDARTRSGSIQPMARVPSTRSWSGRSPYAGRSHQRGVARVRRGHRVRHRGRASGGIDGGGSAQHRRTRSGLGDPRGAERTSGARGVRRLRHLRVAGPWCSAWAQSAGSATTSCGSSRVATAATSATSSALTTSTPSRCLSSYSDSCSSVRTLVHALSHARRDDAPRGRDDAARRHAAGGCGSVDSDRCRRVAGAVRAG